MTAAVAARLGEKSDAYDLETRPGLVLAFAQGEQRGCVNPTVFGREKQHLIRHGAAPADAHRWLKAKAVALRAEMVPRKPPGRAPRTRAGLTCKRARAPCARSESTNATPTSSCTRARYATGDAAGTARLEQPADTRVPGLCVPPAQVHSMTMCVVGMGREHACYACACETDR